MPDRQALTIDGQAVALSNLDKILYPNGFTKAAVIDYYIRASSYLLPHLEDRPVTLKRYPDGVRGEFFYEKDAPGFTPAWVRTFPVPRRGQPGDIRYILINHLKTLVWCANLANLEIHPFLHRAPEIGRPTSIVFDLDPGEGADVLACAEVGFLLREVLKRLGLECFAKVSGSKGMQIYVPLNTPATYALTQPFARTVAELLARERSDLAISEMAKVLRPGKVFIDWSQNADYKTTAGVYSLRARERPWVSLPVTWEELKKVRRPEQLYFEPEPALARLAKTGDLFAPLLRLKQVLPETFVEEAVRGARLRPRRVSARAAGPRSHQGGRRRFALDDHALRLEMQRTVKSWDLPEGLPEFPGEARPAIATADVPPGSLDSTGVYEVIEGSYRAGRLRLFLEGPGLSGDWLLARNSGRDWRLEKSDAAGASAAAAAFLEPMRALAVSKLPEGRRWLYEVKFDGYRALAVNRGGRAVLWSRNRRELNDRFPPIAEACRCLEDGTLVDGEVVALDERGRPSFNLLQHYRSARLVYYVFDLLAWRGRSLVKTPLEERRRLLERALENCGEPVRISRPLDAPPAELVRALKEQGLEGIVAKDADSLYEPGQRTGRWVKLKLNQSHELVIGGYKPGKHHFDYLLVGYYDGRGRLMFLAKIRNGFSPGSRDEVFRQFRGLQTDRCPFANLPEPPTARRGEAITAEVMKHICWLEPRLVAQIEYTDWTAADHLRHARFAGLRDDKDPHEITKERPV